MADFVTNLRNGKTLGVHFSPWQKGRRLKAAALLQRNFRAQVWNSRFASWHTLVARLKSRVSLRSKKAKVRSQLMFLRDDTSLRSETKADGAKREAELLQLLLRLDQDGHARLEVAPGDEEVHYTRQGNADYYTADALAMREALVYDKDIQATLSMFWHVVSGAEGKLIYWPQYQELMMSITRALVSDFNLEECAVIVEEDWRMDTGQVPPNGSMSERQLCKSLFELVDTWVDSIQATDYLEWLQGLFSGIAQPASKSIVDVVYELRPNIKYLLDEDGDITGGRTKDELMRLFIQNIKARHAIEHPHGLLGDESRLNDALDTRLRESQHNRGQSGGDLNLAHNNQHNSKNSQLGDPSPTGSEHGEDTGFKSGEQASIDGEMSHETLEEAFSATDRAREVQDPHAQIAVLESNSSDERGNGAASRKPQGAPGGTQEGVSTGAVIDPISATQTSLGADSGTALTANDAGNVLNDDATISKETGHVSSSANGSSGASVPSAKRENSLVSRNENGFDAVSRGFDVEDIDAWLSMVDFTISARDVIGSSWFASRQIEGALAPAQKMYQHVRSASASRQNLTIRLDLAAEIARDDTPSVRGQGDDDKADNAGQLGPLREQSRTASPTSQEFAETQARLASNDLTTASSSTSEKTLPAPGLSSQAVPVDATSSTAAPSAPDTKDGHSRTQSTVAGEITLPRRDSAEMDLNPSPLVTRASKPMAQMTASAPGSGGTMGSILLRVEQKLCREAAAGVKRLLRDNGGLSTRNFLGGSPEELAESMDVEFMLPSGQWGGLNDYVASQIIQLQELASTGAALPTAPPKCQIRLLPRGQASMTSRGSERAPERGGAPVPCSFAQSLTQQELAGSASHELNAQSYDKGNGSADTLASFNGACDSVAPGRNSENSMDSNRASPMALIHGVDAETSAAGTHLNSSPGPPFTDTQNAHIGSRAAQAVRRDSPEIGAYRNSFAPQGATFGGAGIPRAGLDPRFLGRDASEGQRSEFGSHNTAPTSESGKQLRRAGAMSAGSRRMLASQFESIRRSTSGQMATNRKGHQRRRSRTDSSNLQGKHRLGDAFSAVFASSGSGADIHDTSGRDLKSGGTSDVHPGQGAASSSFSRSQGRGFASGSQRSHGSTFNRINGNAVKGGKKYGYYVVDEYSRPIASVGSLTLARRQPTPDNGPVAIRLALPKPIHGRQNETAANVPEHEASGVIANDGDGNTVFLTSLAEGGTANEGAPNVVSDEAKFLQHNSTQPGTSPAGSPRAETLGTVPGRAGVSSAEAQRRPLAPMAHVGKLADHRASNVENGRHSKYQAPSPLASGARISHDWTGSGDMSSLSIDDASFTDDLEPISDVRGHRILDTRYRPPTGNNGYFEYRSPQRPLIGGPLLSVNALTLPKLPSPSQSRRKVFAADVMNASSSHQDFRSFSPDSCDEKSTATFPDVPYMKPDDPVQLRYRNEEVAKVRRYGKRKVKNPLKPGRWGLPSSDQY